MSVTDVRKDLESRTLAVIAEFDAPVERVWQMWADPRLLERWWGPPSHPATVVDHDLTPGGTVTYFMTGPDGERYHGWWRVQAVDAPHRLELQDGFADDEGRPNPDLPVATIVIALAEREGGTQVEIVTTYPTVEALQQVLDMGVEEGMRQALDQIDALLAS